MSHEDARPAIAEAVKRHFPTAQECEEFGCRGWRVKVQERPREWKGTFDPEWLYILPKERKAGWTLHLWDPRNPDLLSDHQEALSAAGFKVMVGCVQWNRKGPVPVQALAAVIADAAPAD